MFKVNNLTALGNYTFPNATTFGNVVMNNNLEVDGVVDVNTLGVNGTSQFGSITTINPIAVVTKGAQTIPDNPIVYTTITNNTTTQVLSKGGLTTNAGLSGSNLEFTIPVDGYYEIGACLFIQPITSGQKCNVELYFALGGSITTTRRMWTLSKSGGFLDGTAFYDWKQTYYGFENLNAGDVITLKIKQDSTPNASNTISAPTEFWIKKVF